MHMDMLAEPGLVGNVSMVSIAAHRAVSCYRNDTSFEYLQPTSLPISASQSLLVLSAPVPVAGDRTVALEQVPASRTAR